MTPKEKAEELVDSFINLYEGVNLGIAKKHWAKQSALKVVNEIILSRKDDSQFDDTLWAGGSNMYTMHSMYLNYWAEVKKELNNL